MSYVGRTWVCLSVSGSGKSGEVTETLLLQPDEAWDIGSEYESLGKKRIRRISEWSLKESLSPGEEMNDALDRLASRIRASQSRFSLLAEGWTVSIALFVTEENDVFGLGVAARHLTVASAIGAKLEMSFVVDRRDGPSR